MKMKINKDFVRGFDRKHTNDTKEFVYYLFVYTVCKFVLDTLDLEDNI